MYIKKQMPPQDAKDNAKDVILINSPLGNTLTIG